MENPNYVKIKNKKYKINTSYKTAIQCNEIAKNPKIGDYERSLAIIYTLFGDDGLNSSEDWSELIRLGQKYLLLGKENKELKTENSVPDFDYVQDMNYIKASFMYDYGIDLNKIPDMHWWTFSNLLNGLSNSELGNCCILNRVRNLRNYDTSKIKDAKERQRIIEAKKTVALDIAEKDVKANYTEEEEYSINEFYKQMGLDREEE